MIDVCRDGVDLGCEGYRSSSNMNECAVLEAGNGAFRSRSISRHYFFCTVLRLRVLLREKRKR